MGVNIQLPGCAVVPRHVGMRCLRALLLCHSLPRIPFPPLHPAAGTSDPLPRMSGQDSDTGQALLCVASSESVVCWQLAAAYAAAADDQPLPDPIQVLSRPGQVDAICISRPRLASGSGSRSGFGSTQQQQQQQQQQHLAICAGMDVHVFELRSLRNTFRWVPWNRAARLGAIMRAGIQ